MASVFYPPVGNYFEVEFSFGGGAADSAWQEISGIEHTLSFDQKKEGGLNGFTYALPTRGSYSNLTLKRGLRVSSALIDWVEDALLDHEFLPADFSVILKDENGSDLKEWNFVNAIPVKWSISGLNAMKSDIVIESLELRYHYFRPL